MLTQNTSKSKNRANLLPILEGVGLSEEEAKVYLGALHLGPTSVLRISQETGVKRTSVYPILQSLIKKGVVSIHLSGFKKAFVAEDPERIEEVIVERNTAFHRALPQLKNLYNFQGGESTIKYYSGIDAVKGLYKSLLAEAKRGEDYFVISNDEKWFDADQNYFEKFTKDRSHLNLNLRLLLADSPEAHEHRKYQKNYGETIKILPKDVNLNTNLVITPRKLIIQQLTHPIHALLIETKSIIETQRQVFEMLWNKIN